MMAPSLFGRRAVERRAITSLPWDTGQDTFPYAGRGNQKQSLQVGAVYGAVRLLCDSVSMMPIKYRRDLGDRAEPMSPPALFANLLRAGTLPSWITQAMTSLALRGNAVGLITSLDGFGFPTAVTWLSMDDIWVDDDSTPGRPIWYWKGRRIDRDRLIHIPWVQVPGRTLALSPIEVYASTTGAAVAAQTFGQRWMQNGGVPPGTFKNTEAVVDSDEAETIGKRLVRAIKRGRPLVYGKDWDFTAIQIPPEQAQFIESQKLAATVIAGIYGIEPEKIGGETGSSMTYANVEQRALDFVTFTLGPWLVRLEHAFNAYLPERQYVKFNTGALVRSDLKTRFEVYKIGREIGLYNIDEERDLEDLPPLPGGKGSDYTPLTKQQAAGPLQPPPAPADPPARLHAIRSERIES